MERGDGPGRQLAQLWDLLWHANLRGDDRALRIADDDHGPLLRVGRPKSSQPPAAMLISSPLLIGLTHSRY